MKYVVLDYVGGFQNTLKKSRDKGEKTADGPVKAKIQALLYSFAKFSELLNKTRIFKQFQLYKQFTQLQVQRKDFQFEGVSMIYLTIYAYPKELEKFPEKRVQEKVLQTLTLVSKREIEQQNADAQLFLLYVHPSLTAYVPKALPECENADEVYINLMQTHLMEVCTTQDIDKKTARMLFLDDGSSPLDAYMKALSKDWNYVSVYSKCHERWEECYRQLYEEEGLMVECCFTREQCQGDVVIDASKYPKNMQHIYPEGSLVLNRRGILKQKMKGQTE